MGQTESKLCNDTQLQELMNALERSRADLDEFAYVVSHDLKEPIRGIGLQVQFLREDGGDRLPPELLKNLDRMTQLVTRLGGMMDSLLQYSRMTRRPDATPEPIELNQVIQEVLQSLAPLLQQRKAEVKISPPLPSLTGHRARIAEIFRQLISNGIRFNNNAVPLVEISCTPGSSDRESVFHIKDNGIGIPANQFDAIFHVFKKLHWKGEYGETHGMGLTIVKKILEREGGAIWVDSQEGQGSTFHFKVSSR